MADMFGGFFPGLDLNERFFHEVISPILQRAFPGLLYSAAFACPTTLRSRGSITRSKSRRFTRILGIDPRNHLTITPPLDPTPRQFHDRPFRVIGADRHVTAIGEVIRSPELWAIIDHAGWIGGIDQISDSVDLKSHPELSARLARTYGFEEKHSEGTLDF